jgi:hypothetical protein
MQQFNLPVVRKRERERETEAMGLNGNKYQMFHETEVHQIKRNPELVFVLLVKERMRGKLKFMKR